MSNRTFFSSDFHGSHKGIIRGTSSWENKSRCRNFDTVEEHDDTLVKNINDAVQADDTLYFLGDFAFGGFDNIRKLREKINCQNIHVILGNHDHHIERNKNSIQDIFSSVQHYKEITIEGQRIVLLHYAMRVWNLSHVGSWMLYGHSHGSLDDIAPIFPPATWIGDGFYIKNSKSMDVGIDCHPEFRPYSFEELREIMSKREILLNVDHHNQNTN